MGLALRWLARRDHSVHELKQKWSKKEVDEAAQASALERLDELQLIDDRRVAEQVVRQLQERKGRLAVRQALKRKGLPEAVQDAALTPLDEQQQRLAASELLRRNAWRFQSTDPSKGRAKAARFLAGRGFTGDTVFHALDTHFDGEYPGS
jgi:regulatory protein